MNLKKLTNQQLEIRLGELVRQERHLLHQLILHLREFDLRRIYLDRARPSLFDYLTLDLGYSAGSAHRRISAVRLLKDLPDLAGKIQEGEVNLGQVGELTRALKQKENECQSKISVERKREIFAKIPKLSIAATQKILAQELNLQLKTPEKIQTQGDGSVYLQITLTPAQEKKLQRCKELSAHLLSQKNKSHAVVDILEAVMDEFISKYGYARSSGQVGVVVAGVTSTLTSIMEVKSTNKTLTPKTRKIVLSKMQCCQYFDEQTGRICGSQFKLEVDHKISKWAGGTHEDENLTLLCSNHNKHKYRKEAQLKFC